MLITRSSEPGKQLVLNQYLVGQGRNKSRGRLGLPLGQGLWCRHGNPLTCILPWRGHSCMLSGAQTFHKILCVTTAGSPEEREKGAERE